MEIQRGDVNFNCHQVGKEGGGGDDGGVTAFSKHPLALLTC